MEPGRHQGVRLRRLLSEEKTRVGVSMFMYGKGFGWRQDERGSDAKEGTSLRERDVEDAGPSFHGGGEVAGVGASGRVAGGKDLLLSCFSAGVFSLGFF